MIRIFKLNKDVTVKNLLVTCENLGMNPSYCNFIETKWHDIYVSDDDSLERDELVDIIDIVSNPSFTVEDFKKSDDFCMDELETIIRYGNNEVVDILMCSEHYRVFNIETRIDDLAPLINFENMSDRFGISKELGSVLDEWNYTYEYKYRLYNNQIIRFDLQTDEFDIIDIEYLIKFYIEEIGHKMQQDDTCEELFRNDYNTLKNFIDKVVG